MLLNIKIVFLALSLLAVASLSGIAISISEGSAVFSMISLAAFIAIMGSGFTLKKRWREKL
ncbi:hypothetical protein AC622_13565 [Bacillus sp. FJAT-27916]|nr:hypothetical protein AC622_13565 [Bacillus sp. FJAT-27916]